MAEKETYQRDTKNLWFPNQREPNYITEPDLFKAYWAREKDRLLNGFYLANSQVFISGWLYWHTVYWTIELNTEINGKSYKTKGTPHFRDIDYEMSVNKEKAEKEGKIIELVGARGFGKTVWDASIAGYYYTLFDDLEVCISGAYANDIKIVTDKIETGLTNVHPVFKKQRLQSNWKAEVRAGFKDKKTGTPSEKSSNSRVVVRNYEEGNNTMACNGLRPKFHVIDEIGKIKNLKNCVSDTVPCWINPDTGQYLAVIILSGTGGDMEVGQDAGEMFFEPTGWNVLEFDDEWEGRGKIGWFMPATRAVSKYKEKRKLSEYLNIKSTDLDKISILVSNEGKAMKEFVEPRRIKAQKAGQAALVKEKAYYPIKPSESFLIISQNPFNTENASVQQRKLRERNITGTPVELFHDGEKIQHKWTNKRPIEKFPIKMGDANLEGCIVMYEPPMLNPPWGLYVAGIDPYNQEDAANSDSLGAIYIFKRIHSISSEEYQDMLVAQYVGRPDSIFDWYENVRNLLKYYNAIALCENENVGFIQYMKLKNDDHYLADQPNWLKEIHPNSSVQRNKGLHVTPKIRQYLNTNLKAYLDDVVTQEKDDKGSVIKESLGVHKVLDPMLLEEVIKYNATGNFDRIVAASLAVTYARSLDPMIKTSVSDNTDERYKSYFSRGTKAGVNSLFGSTRSKFSSGNTTKRKNKLFL